MARVALQLRKLFGMRELFICVRDLSIDPRELFICARDEASVRFNCFRLRPRIHQCALSRQSGPREAMLDISPAMNRQTLWFWRKHDRMKESTGLPMAANLTGI
jgi:hypothetical protein